MKNTTLKNKFAILLVSAALSFSSLNLAYAEGASKSSGEFSGTMAIVSDYSLRGISQNDSHPALQGSFDYAHSSGIYAGIWGSNVDFNDGGVTNLETDTYAGCKFPFAGMNMDVGGIAYVYPGQHQSVNHYNYFEGKISANKDFGFVNATAQINYSPNYFGSTLGGSGQAVYANLGGTAPLATSGFSLTGAVGHQWIEKNANFGVPDYTDWNLGVGYSWQGFDFSLKYVDTNISESDCIGGLNWCDARALFSISRAFK